MNNDLFFNDQYPAKGALEIERRVREREEHLALLTSEERHEEVNKQKNWTFLSPIKIFLNVL